MEPKPDPYLEDSNKAWKDMILIKRYEHHTLFYHKTRNGNGWHECFLNRDIDKDK